MREFANFTDADVPEPTPHADRTRRFTRNASGRATVYAGRDAWVASDTVWKARP